MSDMRKNKMATMPVGKLLFSMSIPAIFSMFIQGLYNIVDTIYISRISEDAVFTLGIVFPMQLFLIAVALGVAMGSGTLVARRLGQENPDEANKIAATGFILTLINAVLCAVIGILFSRQFLSMFTDNLEIINMGYSYLSIIMGVCFSLYIGIFFERIFQSQGNMIVPMFSLLIGAITNIILDPIFIFGWGVIPAMGIKGAAIATVIGQTCAMCFSGSHMLFKKHEVKLTFKNFDFQWKRVKEIYEIGLPVMVMNGIGGFANTALNAVVVVYSKVAVSSLSLFFKLSSFVFMPVFGLNQGALPVLSFTFGAKNKERYEKTAIIYLATTTLIMGFGTLLFWFQPDLLISMFEVGPELRESTKHVLQIIGLSFVFFGIGIVTMTVFQSLGNSFIGMIMSILRRLVFVVPLAYILGLIGGIDAVWYAFLIAELIVMALFAPYCYKMYKKSFMEEENG